MKSRYLLVVLSFLLFLPCLSYGQSLTLLGEASVSGGVFDIWGYYDNVSGKEYALVGSTEGVFIFDVSNPANPVQVANPIVPGFDIKVFQNYAYCVTGSGGGNQGKILDLTNPASPVIAGSFNSSHNIFIKDGYMYQEYPGLRIMNLNTTPTSPVEIYDDPTGDGHDAAVIGNTLYDFHGSINTRIFNIANPSSPQLLGSINSPGIEYNHSGWPTPDGNFLFICDELSQGASPDITVWDISDLGNMIQVGQFGETNAIVHNLYVRGSYAYVAYYEKGLRIFDITNPAQLNVVAEYDPVLGSTQDYGGTFGVYIYAPSGNIYTSDNDRGLMIFSFDSTGVSIDPISSNIPDKFSLKQNYPNPFNPSTTISFGIPANIPGNTSLRVFDMKGQEVSELLNEDLSSGTYEIQWDAANLPSGVYFYRLSANGFTETRKMILMK